MKTSKASEKKNKRTALKSQGHALTLMLVLSGFILSVWSIIAMPRAYASYDHDIKHPVIAMMLQGIHDGVYPWGNINIAKPMADENSGSEIETAETNEDNSTADSEAANDNGVAAVDEGSEANESAEYDTSAGSQSQTGSDIDGESSNAGYEDANTDTDSTDNVNADETSENEDPVEDLPRSFTDVSDDYFTDALFVGDSRMVGLSEYCEPLDTRADFYVKKALTIYNLADGKAIKSFDGTQKTLWQVLDEKQYGKIYLMVGINEIGVGNSEYFKDAYADVVNRIREAQPDALIFINSIMHVSGAKSNSDSLYNNTNINARNAAIATLADNKTIFYLDINEAVDDENGNLRADITFDDVHLKGSSYEPWHEYLLSHGIE